MAVAQYHCQVMPAMTLPTHVCDDVVKVMLAMVQCRYRVRLAMVLLRQLCHGVMLILSHAGDDVVKSC
jgi:hypothetical protein